MTSTSFARLGECEENSISFPTKARGAGNNVPTFNPMASFEEVMPEKETTTRLRGETAPTPSIPTKPKATKVDPTPTPTPTPPPSDKKNEKPSPSTAQPAALPPAPALSRA